MNSRDIIAKAVYLHASCGVRYWEDATVNGVEDEDGTLIPGRVGDYWEATINLDEGSILNWPEGIVADIHYKVCDDGIYILKDSEGKTLFEYEGCVPSILCPTQTGYGDYVIMHVNADGTIDGWRRDLSEFAEYIKNRE